MGEFVPFDDAGSYRESGVLKYGHKQQCVLASCQPALTPVFVVTHANGGQGGGRVFLFTWQDNNLCPFGAQGVLCTQAQVMQCKTGSSLFLFLTVTSRLFLGDKQVRLGKGEEWVW